MVVSFTPRPFYHRGKYLQYTLDRRLVGPQIRSGRGGEEKNSYYCLRRESKPDHPALLMQLLLLLEKNVNGNICSEIQCVVCWKESCQKCGLHSDVSGVISEARDEHSLQCVLCEKGERCNQTGKKITRISCKSKKKKNII